MENPYLIFDIDGTLWNASPATAKGWSKALKDFNIDQIITAEQNSSVAGNPNRTCIEILMPGLCEKYPGLEEKLDECEIEAIKEMGGTFYPGALESIRELALSRQVFLVSNCQDWYMESFLEFSGLREVVTAFDCHGMSGVPKGEMLKNMKAKFGLEGTTYIGDTVGDQKAAREAGMEFIRAGWGFGKVEEFEIGTRSFETFRNLYNEIQQ
ncbi:MAG: HAD-IA family hydrolase [Candidatus Gracilibacteria bacterium]